MYMFSGSGICLNLKLQKYIFLQRRENYILLIALKKDTFATIKICDKGIIYL